MIQLNDHLLHIMSLQLKILHSFRMSAIFLAVMTLCESGDHLVVSSQLYGGTVNLFRLTLPKFGIKCTFVKPRDTDGFKKANTNM